ncbi:cation-translocating P-type ATPase [Pontibacter sp. G13]|uniref:heavy metal translocating P-type ATPase n=1 Tax=Pontibacter sp. G13 TaxID=3074898 RepID=UPI0028891DB9|nr:cation-translocating P-type ATPase [Pontibacter sp. G13]WNJ20105.1 cation-translocating P-type ATPase [Pontibacter sp. G13]
MDTTHTLTPTQHVEMNVQGMTCTNCALGVERYLQQAGMESVSVDFSSGIVSFDNRAEKSLKDLEKGISQLGFQVVHDPNEAGGFSKIEWLFGLSIIFTIPLILHMFVSWHWLHNPNVQLALSTPVFLMGMYHFGRSGLASLRSGVANMDVLITIGALSAYGYSLYGTVMGLGPDYMFYETAASIISLVLLGNVLEHRAVKKTTSAVKDLVHLQPKSARRITMDESGRETLETIPAQRVKVGDLLQINTGDQIPVDGIIAGGEATLDESMISGESLPVDRSMGDSVVAGTILVSGNLRIEAKAIGKETVLSQIIRMVRQAQADKPDIQQLADRISAVFVPVVLSISALTFILAYWGFDLGLRAAMLQSIAVLVIACPCAMGLATPTAVIVGIGRASKLGLLIKGGRTLEKLDKSQTWVFDKTGTLTTGAFEVAELQAPSGEEMAVQAVIKGIELYSTHPIAQSLAQAWPMVDAAQMREVKEMKGVGMHAVGPDGSQYQLGSFRIAEGLTEDLSHSLYLLKDGQLWASLDLQDQIRPGAANLIYYLKSKGITPVMLSGDRRASCERVADSLGIDSVFAEQLPHEKLERITAWSQDQNTVMVGDGINDAPSLARAQVGISLGKATQVAIQASEVVLLNEDLERLEELHKISHHTVVTIRQNLFWAFFYNTVAIPFAALGYLIPALAAATMALSDVVVIGNSLRLRVKRLK